jgi:hypothetical protein
MNVYIVAGQTGAGKSYFIKNSLIPEMVLRQYKLFIFDINKEYLNLCQNQDTDSYKNLYSNFVGIDNFLMTVKHQINSCIIFEEATAFFSNKGINSKTLLDLQVRKRHTNNVLVFVFHSLRQIPVEIFDFCNYLILHKTNDRADIVNTKFKFNPDILETFEKVKAGKDKHFHIIKKLY